LLCHVPDGEYDKGKLSERADLGVVMLYHLKCENCGLVCASEISLANDYIRYFRCGGVESLEKFVEEDDLQVYPVTWT
jgi:hypothetical protein